MFPISIITSNLEILIKTRKHRLIPLLVVHVSTYPSQGTLGQVECCSLSFSAELADYAQTRNSYSVKYKQGLRLEPGDTPSSFPMDYTHNKQMTNHPN